MLHEALQKSYLKVKALPFVLLMLELLLDFRARSRFWRFLMIFFVRSLRIGEIAQNQRCTREKK
jgi:hypothetical protein